MREPYEMGMTVFRVGSEVWGVGGRVSFCCLLTEAEERGLVVGEHEAHGREVAHTLNI